MFREKEICNAIRTAYLYLFPDKKERKRALSRLNMELVAQSVRYRGESVLASIFLGGKEPTTLKELAAVLGKETIDTYNIGKSRGRETSHSLNYQKLGKELMSQDELAVMDGGKCILQLRGVRPFLSDKYDITKHPNFQYTADADDKNAFDIEAFLSARLKLKPNEVCDVYEVDTEGA